MSEPEFTGALLVAVPMDDDPILSQVEDPHVSLLWFGEAVNLPADLVDDIREHVDVVTSMLGSFEVAVSGACVLGADRAVALLVESDELVVLRNELAADGAVRRAQMLAERQFPWWIPHLTLGYDGEIPKTLPQSVHIGSVGFWLGGQHTEYPLTQHAVLVDYAGSEIDAGQESPFLASGMIPPVHSLADLPVALSFAETHPDSRWYVEKRCVALGVKDRIPAWSSR